LKPNNRCSREQAACEDARLVDGGAARVAARKLLDSQASPKQHVKLFTLENSDDLRRAAPRWDDLFLRSETALPTLRAEQIALWLASFASHERFRALVVEDEGRLVAGLPLVDRRRARMFKTSSLPTNLWSASGDLLLDPLCDVVRATDLLAEGIQRLSSTLCWFDLVPLGMPRWQALLAALDRRGLTTSIQALYTIGQIEIGGDWAAYEASRSRNHRQQMRKLARRLDRQGETYLRRYSQCDRGELPALLKRGFEVEDRSWKGTEGTSVLRTPGGFEFYLRQAELLNSRGELQLVFLEHAGRPIAFEYGWLAKQTYFSPKVGYDDEFAAFRPGQLLRMKLYEEFHALGDCRRVDFLGPLSEATARWSNADYEISRLVIAGTSQASRWTLRLIEALQAARRSTPSEPSAERRADDPPAPSEQLGLHSS